jgi:hypothetical protein
MARAAHVARSALACPSSASLPPPTHVRSRRPRRRLDKAAAQAGAKAARAEDNFSRCLGELRIVTLELQQAEETIQSLLKQLIAVKEQGAAPRLARQSSTGSATSEVCAGGCTFWG